jgi:hypothetical protein
VCHSDCVMMTKNVTFVILSDLSRATRGERSPEQSRGTKPNQVEGSEESKYFRFFVVRLRRSPQNDNVITGFYNVIMIQSE